MSAAIPYIIKSRISCRTYDGRPLSEKDRNALASYITGETGNPLGLSVRLRIIDTGDIGQKIGTYGMIRGGKTYLCGAVEKGENALSAYGYVVEKVVLQATSMGVGTCWLGGTFSRSAFADAIGLTENEWLPAVSPLGYPREKGGLWNKAVRAVAGAEKRKSWAELFFDENIDTPLTPDQAGVYADPLEMVRLGPSAVNKQPWRIVRDGKLYHFFTAGKGGSEPDKQHDRIDMGIAMCHFELTAREQGLPGGWVFADNTLPGLAYIASWDPAQV